ncbi:MAG: ABC transporter ATP-binding protein [Clostridiaceae bacterium]
MRGITKHFGGMTANDHIDFQVEQGEIHCLLGENGAGKSTLMNVLFGLHCPDEGCVEIEGQLIPALTPRLAYQLGIGMVHQHFMLINHLTCLENIILGNEPGTVVINRRQARAKVKALSDQYHFNIELDALVCDLSVGMKQRVEILKTLYRGASIIILDEPTAVLTPIEADQLLSILKDMRAQGKTIIFITHKLKETLDVADRITILRGGKSVALLEACSATPETLARLMVGHDVTFELEKPDCPQGDVVLKVEDVRLLPNAQSTVSFEVHAGEIFGIAGVEGNGQQQLEQIIMGLTRPKSGRILYQKTNLLELSQRARRRLRIAYIPSDRLKQALLSHVSLQENFLLGNQYDPNYVRRGLIQTKTLRERTVSMMQQFDVRATSAQQEAGSLSGGNQQKFVLAREVSKHPQFVLACQPVRGLDIGAIKYIHNVLLKLRSEGAAILLISAELSDIFQLSDTIGVLYKGELMDIRKADAYDNESISLLMAGRKEAKPDEANQ